MAVNPFALLGALARAVQRLLQLARSVAKAGIGAARDLTRTRSELLAENALLRQQVIVLRRGRAGYSCHPSVYVLGLRVGYAAYW